MAQSYTSEQFKEKAGIIHKLFFNYDKSNYINVRTKIIITCPVHGDFLQLPKTHLSGAGCDRCTRTSRLYINRRNKKYTDEEFKIKASSIHKNFFDYSKVKYINNKTKICIICPKHGELFVSPGVHLQGYGCSKCKNIKSYTNEEFIKLCSLKHNNFYNYDECSYINYYAKIIIICPIHGKFLQRAGDHLRGNGCNECGGSVLYTNEKFLYKANKKHNNKYTYPNLSYINSQSFIEICCPKHGIFKQRPAAHLYGYGCSICFESNGEKKIREFLETKEIIFEPQKTFDECRSILKYERKLPFDFFLPKYNLCIEYDGEQHFSPIPIRGISMDQAHLNFERVQVNDQIKTQYCKDKGIQLFRIPYTEFKRIEDILKINLSEKSGFL